MAGLAAAEAHAAALLRAVGGVHVEHLARPAQVLGAYSRRHGHELLSRQLERALLLLLRWRLCGQLLVRLTTALTATHLLIVERTADVILLPLPTNEHALLRGRLRNARCAMSRADQRRPINDGVVVHLRVLHHRGVILRVERLAVPQGVEQPVLGDRSCCHLF